MKERRVTESTPSRLRICRADYRNAIHADALVQLLDAYAQDPAGGGQALSEFAKTNLVKELAARPQAFSVLAFADEQPVGLINCLEGFSTFACRPLVNIHDVAVLPGHRGPAGSRADLGAHPFSHGAGGEKSMGKIQTCK